MEVAASARIHPGVKAGISVLSAVGLVGLALVFWLGFEEPNAVMLWACGAMTLAVPLGVIAHLWTTRDLTPETKRAWWKEFRSADVWSALAEYLSSSDLVASAHRRAEEARSPRSVPHR